MAQAGHLSVRARKKIPSILFLFILYYTLTKESTVLWSSKQAVSSRILQRIIHHKSNSKTENRQWESQFFYESTAGRLIIISQPSHLHFDPVRFVRVEIGLCLYSLL